MGLPVGPPTAKIEESARGREMRTVRKVVCSEPQDRLNSRHRIDSPHPQNCERATCHQLEGSHRRGSDLVFRLWFVVGGICRLRLSVIHPPPNLSKRVGIPAVQVEFARPFTWLTILSSSSWFQKKKLPQVSLGTYYAL